MRLVAGAPPWSSTSYLSLAGAAEADAGEGAAGAARGGLAADVAELRRSRLDLVDAFETERGGSSGICTTASSSGWSALTMTLGLAELDLPEGEGAGWW